MRASRDFDPQDPTESEILSFDFVNDLSMGDSIVPPAPVVAISLISGTDPNYASRLTGSPMVNGTLVGQRIAGCVAGCRYRLTATVSTYLGNQITLYADIPPEPSP